MADITKNANVIQMVAAFTDGDDRTISVPNPKNIVTADAVNSISAFIRENNLLLGDKAGADFTRIKSARLIKDSTTYFDLTD